MAWEREAVAAEALGIRVVRVRIGILLDPRGGALQRMLPPFRLGLGGRLGDGRQWMSWIHRDDLAELFRFAVEKPIRGALNAVAPNPLANAGFTRELARAVHRPAVFPAPQVRAALDVRRDVGGSAGQPEGGAERRRRRRVRLPLSASRPGPGGSAEFVNRVAFTGPKGARPAKRQTGRGTPKAPRRTPTSQLRP